LRLFDCRNDDKISIERNPPLEFVVMEGVAPATPRRGKGVAGATPPSLGLMGKIRRGFATGRVAGEIAAKK
jgi:hypothetical protein